MPGLRHYRKYRNTDSVPACHLFNRHLLKDFFGPGRYLEMLCEILGQSSSTNYAEIFVKIWLINSHLWCWFYISDVPTNKSKDAMSFISFFLKAGNVNVKNVMFNLKVKILLVFFFFNSYDHKPLTTSFYYREDQLRIIFFIL